MGVISARAAGDVVELRPEDTRWLRFVAGASEASAFHEPGWLAALTAGYGYQSLVLALMAPGGEVIAGLPLSRIRRRLSGVAYVSLPFTDHCPPLARNEDALLLLAQGLERWRRRVRISTIEIRGPLPGTGSLAARGIIQISVSALRRRRASARPVERGDVAGSEQEHPSHDSEAMRR